jgi:hypothetical protein
MSRASQDAYLTIQAGVTSGRCCAGAQEDFTSDFEISRAPARAAVRSFEQNTREARKHMLVSKVPITENSDKQHA